MAARDWRLAGADRHSSSERLPGHQPKTLEANCLQSGGLTKLGNGVKETGLDQRRSRDKRSEAESFNSHGELKLTSLERAAELIPGLGIIMSLCASVFLGTAGMLVKLTTSVHGIEVAVLRNFIQLVIYAAIILVRGIRWTPMDGEFWPVVTRALLGGFSITLSYSALKLIPLGDATTIRFSLPIWTLIMSYFFLRESCSLFKIFAVAISTSGVLLVAKPDMCVALLHRLLNWLALKSDTELELNRLAQEQTRSAEQLGHVLLNPEVTNHSLMTNQTPLDSTATPTPLTYSPDPVHQLEGCLMALTASIFLSIGVIALRMSKRTPAEVCILWLSFSSVFVGSTMLGFMDKWSVPNNWLDILYILLNGVCGAIGQWFMTSSLKVEQSGVIAVARTADIEVAFLYSAFLLGEEIRLTSILGSVLVSLGVISVVLPKWLGCGERDTAAAEGDIEQAIKDSTSKHSDTGFEDHLTTMTTSTGAGDTIGQTNTGRANLMSCIASGNLYGSHKSLVAQRSGPSTQR